MTTEAKPTVCQLLHSLRTGGAEVLAAQLARRLSESYRFVFTCLDELGTLGEDLRREGFTVEVLGRRPGVDCRCARRLRRFWRRERVALVHAHQYTPLFYALAARHVHRRPPILFTEHGRHFPDYPRRKRIVFNRLMLRRRDRVIAVGKSVSRALVANEGIPANRIEVIYNGVDSAAFDTACDDRGGVRSEIGVGPDDFVVIQVARLDELKDHATAIRAIERVCRQIDGVRLVLVGEGPLRQAIEKEVSSGGVERFVRMLGLRGDVPRLLRAADLLLLSSISEGIPVTLIEAMFAGLPVVSTDVGGVPEVVQHGQTGLLTPARDDAALAGAILQIARQPELRERMGRAGRRRAEEMFSEAQMHAAYRRHYEEMLGG